MIILIQNPCYLAQLAMEYLNQGLQIYDSNVWMATLFQVIRSSFQEEIASVSLSNIINQMNLNLPFFSLPQPIDAIPRPNFCEAQWGRSDQPITGINPSSKLISTGFGDVIKREYPGVSESQKQRNGGSTSQTQDSNTGALTLESQVNLEFTKIIHEMVIILMPQQMSKLELRLNFPNLMIGEHFYVRIAPLARKRKAQEMIETSMVNLHQTTILSLLKTRI